MQKNNINMKDCRLIIIKVLCFICLYNVASAQNQQAYFKSTTKSLVNYILTYDTASIHKLFDEDEDNKYEEVKNRIKI